MGNFDVFAYVPGVGAYADAAGKADQLSLSGVGPVRVLSVAQLIIAKRAAGRPKDLAAIPELEAIVDLRAHENE